MVADRCTDRTVQISAAHGARVVESVGNTQAKAGALNQVLVQLLPRLSDDDAVLVMDSDTSLTPEFIARATRRLHEEQPGSAPLGGVGAVFFGYPCAGWSATSRTTSTCAMHVNSTVATAEPTS